MYFSPFFIGCPKCCSAGKVLLHMWWHFVILIINLFVEFSSDCYVKLRICSNSEVKNLKCFYQSVWHQRQTLDISVTDQVTCVYWISILIGNKTTRVSTVPLKPFLAFLGLVTILRLSFVYNSNTVILVQLLVQRDWKTYSYSDIFYVMGDLMLSERWCEDSSGVWHRVFE